MRAVLPKVGRAILLGLATSLAACSDAGSPLIAPLPDQPHLLLANSTETLASGLNLTNGSSVTWNVSMPSSGTIRLSFDGRINYGSTAGNSTILEVLVNGVPVTAAHLYNKDSLYTYPNRGGTENYYALRGSGQAAKYWGLFWSPDFTSNNTSSNYYYVQGANAYNFVMTITGLVSYGQVNTIQLVNRGGWVQSATGHSPTIALQNVQVQAVSPPPPTPPTVEIYGSTTAPPYESCTHFASPSGGTQPYSYQWYVNGWPVGDNASELYYVNDGYDYEVSVVLTDANGQQASDWEYVTVQSGWGPACFQ